MALRELMSTYGKASFLPTSVTSPLIRVESEGIRQNLDPDEYYSEAWQRFLNEGLTSGVVRIDPGAPRPTPDNLNDRRIIRKETAPTGRNSGNQDVDFGIFTADQLKAAYGRSQDAGYTDPWSMYLAPKPPDPVERFLHDKGKAGIIKLANRLRKIQDTYRKKLPKRLAPPAAKPPLREIRPYPTPIPQVYPSIE